MPATTAVTDGPDGPVVRIAGAFDVGSSRAVEQVLLQALADGGNGSLTIDLQSVHFMDSTGLRALSVARKRAEELGGHIELVHVVHEVRRVIHMLGMAPYFTIADDASPPA